MGMAVCGEWSKGCQTKLVLATFFVQCQCSFLWVQSETNQTSALKTSTFTGKNQLVQVCTSSYPAGPSWPFPSQVSVGTDMQEWNQNLCSALAYVYVYMRRCVYIYVYNAYIIYPITCFYWMCFSYTAALLDRMSQKLSRQCVGTYSMWSYVHIVIRSDERSQPASKEVMLDLICKPGLAIDHF